MTRIRNAQRVSAFADSVFAEMTRLARLHNAVNLSQGFPDFEAPQAIKDAACTAIQAEQNQYAPPYGTVALRQAIASDVTRRYGVPISADDQVIVFEPFYENYGPGAIIAGAEPVYVRLHGPDWQFDPDDLARAFTNRTRAIVINSPNNPTGKVFTRDELEVIAALCRQWNVLAISDEIYERIVYTGHAHVSIASLPGMAERTVITSGLSKTYSVTGWRIGWAIAPPALTTGIRKIHDYLTVAAPTPFHDAAVAALSLPDTYYLQLVADYQAKRDLMMEILGRHGFAGAAPSGAYYVMTDVSRFGYASDVEFAQYLVKEIGVATVPGSSFYMKPATSPQSLRFCFSKRDETLHEADRRFARLQVATDRNTATDLHR